MTHPIYELEKGNYTRSMKSYGHEGFWKVENGKFGVFLNKKFISIADAQGVIEGKNNWTMASQIMKTSVDKVLEYDSKISELGKMLKIQRGRYNGTFITEVQHVIIAKIFTGLYETLGKYLGYTATDGQYDSLKYIHNSLTMWSLTQKIIPYTVRMVEYIHDELSARERQTLQGVSYAELNAPYGISTAISGEKKR